MRPQSLLFAMTFGSAIASAAVGATHEAGRLEGTGSLADGAGGLVLLVVPTPPRPEHVPTEEWDAYLESDDGAARWRLSVATRPAIHVLPAGRYRLATIRSVSGFQINGMMGAKEWLEVVAGRIAYAGRWWIRSTVVIGEPNQVRGSVTFPREPLDALGTAVDGPLARYELWLAPAGAAARPLTPPAGRTPRG